jgi:hypothetical protein
LARGGDAPPGVKLLSDGKIRVTTDDPDRDPFAERPARYWQRRCRLLGIPFLFRSRSRALLQLVRAAYGSLPSRRQKHTAPVLTLELQLTRDRGNRHGAPPPMRTFSGPAGLLGGIMDSGNYVLLSPAQHTGLVAVSADLLRRPYCARYELLEFAVYTLASRSLSLLSLHAACVGRAGRGLLLMGASGAGKSTLALHCVLQGLEFAAEDAAFVDAARLTVTGVPNFVHVRPESIRLIEHRITAARLRRAPRIRRRSGVAKCEIDLRSLGGRLARAPMALSALVFLSRSRAAGARLAPLCADEALRRFAAAQPYATLLPGWRAFRAQLARLPAFELRRGTHPTESVVALRHLLGRPALTAAPTPRVSKALARR